ncbi:hypothetical protein TNCV_1296331 [Trichonephila clavipes]|uniref:Uncharacterized protein n=1 Tax=Trichonephila clavipes TaxID=2585209 RepID=A0A8X6VD43_TRICX|nr:hypothetical protein TNCV_1296331 [Trichonephila clavipes]
MWELKKALSSPHHSSPGPNGISNEFLHHLNEDSLNVWSMLVSLKGKEPVHSSVLEWLPQRKVNSRQYYNAGKQNQKCFCPEKSSGFYLLRYREGM